MSYSMVVEMDHDQLRRINRAAARNKMSTADYLVACAEAVIESEAKARDFAKAMGVREPSGVFVSVGDKSELRSAKPRRSPIR